MSGFARGKVLAAGVALSLLVGPSPAEGLNMCAKEPLQADGIVRLSRIEVYPEHLDAYVQLAWEVGEVSLRTEPGVLTMYALAEKANPCRVTILETYASVAAYRKHIASPHFQKYKTGTAQMVKSLSLDDQVQLNPGQFILNGFRSGAAVVAARGGVIGAWAQGRGVQPILSLLDSDSLNGAIVVDKVIGRAAAAVAIVGWARHVHGLLMGEDAKAFLESHGVRATAERMVTKILNRDLSASCPMEATVGTETEPEKMVAALRGFVRTHTPPPATK